jgi:hypothetical protein
VKDVCDRLIDIANETGRPASEVLRQHFLEGVLRRLPAGASADFVLRGSMLTRIWAQPFPRVACDLDFLGVFPHSVRDAANRFLPSLAREHEDGIRFGIRRCSAKGIWEETAFPGVRLSMVADVFGQEHHTTVDVGFGDPLVPPAELLAYPLLAGGTANIWAVHPATLIAWKLHGLAEWGEKRWRPKDVLDLWLLTGRFELPAETLAAAIQVAFESRGFAAADADRVLQSGIWESFPAKIRWEQFRRAQIGLPLDRPVAELVVEIRRRLAPALALLDPSTPTPI